MSDVKYISGRFGSVQRIPDKGDGVWGNLDSGVTSPSTKSGWSDSFLPAEVGGEGGTTVSAVTSWTLENKVNTISYIASNTRGYKGKLEGIHDCSGTINGIGGCPPIGPGERFLFLGYIGPESGQVGDTKGRVYSIAARASNVSISLDYKMQNPITWSVQWQSDYQNCGDELQSNAFNYIPNCDPDEQSFYLGDILSTDEGFWDYTKLKCETLMPSRTCNLEIGDLDSLCLLDAQINFTTELSTYANSCSAKSGGWQSSMAGATDCQITANIQGGDFDAIFNTCKPGFQYPVRFYVSGNSQETNCKNLAYWEFYKMFFGSFGGLNVDMQSNNPLQFSCQMDFNAFPTGQGCAFADDCGGECDGGYIIYKTTGGTEVTFVNTRNTQDTVSW